MESNPADLKPCVHKEDDVIWTPTTHGVYSSRSAWDALRTVRSLVGWYAVLWFKHHVPRWGIIQWIVCWGRLGNLDRFVVGYSYCNHLCSL